MTGNFVIDTLRNKQKEIEHQIEGLSVNDPHTDVLKQGLKELSDAIETLEDHNDLMTIKTAGDYGIDDYRIEIKFNASLSIKNAGCNLPTAIKDDLLIFNRIKNRMMRLGVSDGDAKYIVQVDDISHITVNGMLLAKAEREAMLLGICEIKKKVPHIHGDVPSI